MRAKKNEEIRRLLAAARSMCELSSLEKTRKKISEAIMELEILDVNRKKEVAEKKINSIKTSNPARTIQAIDAEISNEMKKLTKNNERLIND